MSDFKKTINEINDYLGIEPSVILNNSNLTEGEKMRNVFKMTLSAALQKQAQNLLLEQDLNIEDFVESQCELFFDGEIALVPPMYLTRELINKLKNANGDTIKNEVGKIFDEIMKITRSSTIDMIGKIFIDAGILAVSVVGLAASIEAIITGVATAPAIVGIIASGIGVVTSIASLIKTISELSDRSFFGILINDSQYDMCIEGDYGNFKKSGGATRGIYLEKGSLRAIFKDGSNPPCVPRRNEKEKPHTAAVGLFKFVKDSVYYGSEGIIRIKAQKPEHHDMNLIAACPMSSDNRMMISFNHTGSRNDNAYKDMYKEMNNRTTQTEERGGLIVKSTINDSRNSPAYGIASITQK